MRFQANYSAPKSDVDDNLGGSRAYFANHLAEWQAVPTPVSPIQINAAGALASGLATAQQKLNETAVPGGNQGVIKYTLSAFAVYTFTDGAAQGLSFGGGPTRLGSQNIRTGGSLESPGYITWSALVAYRTKVANYPVKLQLNVDNVFNNDALVFTDFNTVGTENQGSGYYFVTPRKFTLSATINF